MAKKKKPTWLLFAMVLCVTIPALALLKTTVFSNNKNVLTSDNSTKYDIVVDLGEGGRFESGEFSKMTDGKWIHKYLPSKNPITLPKPVKDGYIFNGWLIPGDPTPKPEFIIPAWGKGNINLSVKWKAAESMLIPGKQFSATIRKMSGYGGSTRIEFVKMEPNPSGIDVSASRNGSIMAWVENRIIKVACSGNILANADASEMFAGFNGITNMNLENLYTNKTRNMKDIFNQCTSVKSLDLSNWDTSNVTDMSNMFRACSALTSADLTSFNTSNVTTFDFLFLNCVKLQSVDLSSFDTSRVTTTNSMFSGCSSLTKLDLKSFDSSNLKISSAMFSDCIKLTSINGLNELFNKGKLINTKSMFKNCRLLSAEITIIGTNNSLIDGMFTGCSSNSNAKFIVKYKDSVTKELARKMVATKNPDDHVYLYEEPKAVLMSGRDFNYALSKISGFDYVKEVKFVKGKPSSGVNVAIEGEAIASIDGEVLTIASEQKICANPDSSYMFKSFGTFDYGGSNLRIDKITFNNFDTSLVTNMRSMFEDCPKLISLDLRSFDTSQVTDMSRMFFFCRDITDINVSSFNTTNVTNMCSMFHMCTCITQLDLGSFNTVNVTNMSNMFQGDQYLSSLDISSFRTPNVRNMSYMFSACVDLRHIDIYNFDTRNTTDMTYMFNLCENISCEFTVMNPNCNVSGAFSGIDSLDLVSVTINYTRGCESLVDKMIKSALVGARIKKGNEVPMPVALEVRKSQLKANTQLPFDTESSKTNAPVRLILNNGTMAQYPKQVMTIQDNKIPRLYSPDLNPQYAGQFGGYYYDQQFTKPVNTGDIITKDLTIYARW